MPEVSERDFIAEVRSGNRRRTIPPQLNKEEIISQVRGDKRTSEEIFTSLTNRIKARSSLALTDSQAADAARRLVKYFELFVDKSSLANSAARQCDRISAKLSD